MQLPSNLQAWADANPDCFIHDLSTDQIIPPVTLPLTIDVEFIEPASYLPRSQYKFVYLSDPVGNGDERVGKIIKCPYSGMFYMQWDYVPHTNPLTKRSFDTYSECQCHVHKNVKDWWLEYHTLEEDS